MVDKKQKNVKKNRIRLILTVLICFLTLKFYYSPFPYFPHQIPFAAFFS